MTQEEYDQRLNHIKSTSPRYTGVMIWADGTLFLTVIPYEEDKTISILEDVKSHHGLDAIYKITFGSLANHVFIDFDWERRMGASE